MRAGPRGAGQLQSTALIAATGLGGYAIAQQPVAAAAFPDGAFAVAHTDAGGESWPRIGNLGCAHPPPTVAAPPAACLRLT